MAKNPWKEEILAFNRRRKHEGEKALELDGLLSAIETLPPGQKKKLTELLPALQGVLERQGKA